MSFGLLLVLSSLAGVQATKETNLSKEQFYDSDIFQGALVGSAMVHGKSKYVRAKLEYDADTKQMEMSAIILEDKYLMADRMSTRLFFKEGSFWQSNEAIGTDTKIEIEGKVSDVLDATIPVDYFDCKMSFTLLRKTDKHIEFSVEGDSKCHFNGTFNLDFVDFVSEYSTFIIGFLSLSVLQILGFVIMTSRAKQDFDVYMKKYSMIGLLCDSTMNSCILYHFGVLLPIDIRVVVPQIVLMIYASFFWMQKLIHHVNRNPPQGWRKSVHFICTIIMMIGGLYIPSIDQKSVSLLIAVVIPLILQVWNSFENRVASFSIEYNLLFKVPQMMIIAYIYGWPGYAAHLLPTYPRVSMKAIVIFSALIIISFLQKMIHPRFYIKTADDHKRIQHQPKRVSCQDLISDVEAKVECSICLCDLKDTPEEKAMITTCGHTFHEACLTHWLMRNEVCPICRKLVAHPDEDHYSN